MDFLNSKILAITLVSICCTLTTFAQQTQKDSVALNREMTLEREYNPDIKNAVKLGLVPDLREPQTGKPKIEFSNYAKPFPLDNSINPLNPKPLYADIAPSKYHGYVTAGLSTLLDIDGDAGYHILDNDKNLLGLWFSHRSSRSDVTSIQTEEKQNFKLNDNFGGVNFIHNFDKFKLLADVKYTWSSFNYSGLSIGMPMIDPLSLPYSYTLNINDNYPNQINNMFETRLGIESNEESNIFYKANASYTFYKQKYGMDTTFAGRNENRLLFDIDIHSNRESDQFFGFRGATRTNIYSNIDNYNNNISLLYLEHYTYKMRKLIAEAGNDNFSVATLNPYFYKKFENADVLLGAKVDMEFGGLKKWNIAPTVHFRYYPNEKFMFYANADGGRADNSNYNIFYENRYVHPEFRVRDSRSPLDAQVGVKIVPVSGLSLEAFGGYKITNDEHFYSAFQGFIEFIDEKTYQIADLRRTEILVDYKDANTLKFGLKAQYEYQDRFSFSVAGVYNKWSIRKNSDIDSLSAKEAWYKPELVADIALMYRMNSLPLRFHLLYHGEYNRRTVVRYDFETYKKIRLEQINDLSFKAEYAFCDRFSAYLKANNIINSKYDIWYGYPAQPFSVLAGVSFLF